MGGAETLITEYALKIDKEKFDIIIVTLSGRNNTINEEKLEREGIKVAYLGDKLVFKDTTNFLKRIINKIHRYILFSRLIKEEKPQIIHTHLSTDKYVIPLNVKKKDITLYHTLHSEIHVLYRELKRRLSTKYCIKQKDMIPIALHNKMQQEANDFFRIDNCIVVPNGIDMRRFRNVSVSRKTMINSLNIKKGAFIVGHVGRFSKQKNHEFLINLFAKVKKNRMDAHLVLIGKGKLESKIKQQVKELGLENSVSFLGNRGDIPELMNIMDVFVFPSQYEGFGNVLIEAQAAGVKCVVSDSVPNGAFITNLVVPLSLDEPIDRWCDHVTAPRVEEKEKGNLERHDINSVIKLLENIYLESSNINSMGNPNL